MKRICVFGASSALIDKKYTDDAYAAGVLLADSGIEMVFGGGRTGLMGAAARGVHDRGGRLTGIIPEKLNIPGIASEICDDMIVTATMHERKAAMERLSDGYLVLPGGYGTFEEMFEVLTLDQLGYMMCPVVLLNTLGVFDHTIAQIDRCVADGFINPAFRQLMAVANTPEEAVRMLISYTPPDLPNKVKDALADER